MSIQAFISQPAENSYHAAYRPVVVRVSATANLGGGFIPPVVYCDIYFNDVFYKTLSKTQYSLLNDTNSEWSFDLQDAAQEYLTKYIAAVGQSAIEEVTQIITKAFCRMRCSGINTDGFIEQDGTVPVQATSSSAAVAGTGTLTNTWYIVNATLQHTDVQDLASHLNYFKQRTWASDVQPLTHRPEGYGMLPQDSDSFPIIDSGDHSIQNIRLNYRNCNQSTFGQASISAGTAPTCTATVSDPIMLHNELGWLISWTVLTGSPGKFFISTPALSGGAPYEVTGTFIQWPELAVGTHPVSLRPMCFIGGEWYFGAEKTFNIVVTACVDLALDPVPTIPDAVADAAYSYSIEFEGSVPLILSAITKPAWMTIAASGNLITHTGTPTSGDVDTGVEVSYTVSNCGGPEIIIDQTIDVTAAVVVGTLTISNSRAGGTITNIFPPFFTLVVGNFPIANGGSAQGETGDYEGTITISVTLVSGTASIRILLNGSLVDLIPVSGSGSFESSEHTFTTADDIEIQLV